MKKEPVLVIMAAGMGSRFGGLKQIEPVTGKGELIIDFSLYDAVMAGFKKAVFVIKKENEEDFRRLLDDKAGKYIDIEYVYQELGDLRDSEAVSALSADLDHVLGVQELVESCGDLGSQEGRDDRGGCLVGSEPVGVGGGQDACLEQCVVIVDGLEDVGHECEEPEVLLVGLSGGHESDS